MTTVKQQPGVELLAPAGNFEKLEMAIHFGADAVYLGGKHFSLRGHCDNFAPDELEAAIAYCHRHGVKAYVTCNIYPRNEDLAGIRKFLGNLAAIEPDAVIISDPGVFTMAREVAPAVALHVSTQANTTSRAAADFWQTLGADRINVARELSLEEIAAICTHSRLPVEVFVHGAMCMAYSGRCLLSSFLAQRDGNRGLCAQPCRWQYALVEEKRPGRYMPVQETHQGSFVFHARDLCMIAHIPQLIEAGVQALKIEGRMKGIHYLASTVNAYREAIDAYYRNEGVPPSSRRDLGGELEAVNNRGYGTGFYFGPPDQETDPLAPPPPGADFRLVGKVLGNIDGAEVRLEVRNRFYPGDRVEIISPGRPIVTDRIQSIRDDDGALTEVARPGAFVSVRLSHACRRWDLLRTVQRHGQTADRGDDRNAIGDHQGCC
ncbi:MAG: U32 family peptidase [Desulfobacterales bacterium]